MKKTIAKLPKSAASLARSTLLCAAALLLVACAGSLDRDQTTEQKLAKLDYQILDPVDHISNFNISGWSYVDDFNVVFKGGHSDHYLLTLKQRCLNLRNAIGIAFSTTTGRVSRFDRILVRDPTGLGPESCLIDRIYKLKKPD